MSEPDFDPEILESILKNVEFNQHGKVAKEEFCISYIEAMNCFEEEIYNTKEKIADIKRIRQDYEK